MQTVDPTNGSLGTPQKPNSGDSTQSSLIRLAAHGASLGLRMGIALTVPLIGAVLLGRTLDRLWGTSPLVLLSAILLALVVSGTIMTRDVRSLLRRS